MPSRMRSCGRSPVTSRPSHSTRPADGLSTPITVLSSVVLPTPLRPMTHTRPPSGTSMDTRNKTCVRRYATSRPSTLNTPSPDLRRAALVPAAPDVDLLHPLVGLHLGH